MDLFDSHHDMLTVAEDERILGRVTRASVLAALTAKRGMVADTTT